MTLIMVSHKAAQLKIFCKAQLHELMHELRQQQRLIQLVNGLHKLKQDLGYKAVFSSFRERKDNFTLFRVSTGTQKQSATFLPHIITGFNKYLFHLVTYMHLKLHYQSRQQHYLYLKEQPPLLGNIITHLSPAPHLFLWWQGEKGSKQHKKGPTQNYTAESKNIDVLMLINRICH